MVHKFWGGLGLFATIVASAGAAGAADLAVKAPIYKAPPVILSDWSGFYLGVHGGYGFGDTSFDSPFTNFSAKPKGGLVGGHAGYNWQYGSIVTGLEVDYSAADLKSSGDVYSRVWDRGEDSVTYSRNVKVDQLASARARLGYIVLPNLLAFGTAGLGWGHTEVDETRTRFDGGVTTVRTGSADANEFGWVAGGGLEYKIWGNFIARAEYLHYDFGKTTYSFPNFTTKDASTSVDVARGGVSYKF
jgi:outer membrane immunogenic protein